MKPRSVTSLIKTILSMVFAAILVACDNQQGMMHGGSSTHMGNWNWVGILIGLAIVFLIGYLVAKRRK